MCQARWPAFRNSRGLGLEEQGAPHRRDTGALLDDFRHRKMDMCRWIMSGRGWLIRTNPAGYVGRNRPTSRLSSCGTMHSSKLLMRGGDCQIKDE